MRNISDTVQQRHSVYLDVTGSITLPAFVNGGWLIKAAADMAHARELVLSGKFSVGIISFDSRSDGRLKCIQDLIVVGNEMEWIALVPPGLCENKRIRRLICNSFYDYHTLPIDPDRLEITLGRAFGIGALRQQEMACERVQENEADGSSPAIVAAFRAIRKIALSDASVLITGETGTGKERAARIIHARSSRAYGSFVAVNCAALPRELIQSELFGHEKGAFTGAHQRSIGKIETAAGGTLFLDEIGDLPLELQVNLLRFLQDKVIERVGGHTRIPVDVRVIAATHIDLEEAIKKGRFREDLLYRLNVVRIDMPPLREREGDVELLAHFFFDQFTRPRRSSVKGISIAAIHSLKAHDWPGNVRELINRIERAVAMCDGPIISPADLGLEPRREHGRILSLDQFRARAEKEAITNALRHAGHNVSKAAAELKVSRITLYRLMDKLGIRAA
ncbi:MAG: sigma 54-interacting transcriptional regulator [Burkholderiales bacterium]